MVASSPSLSLAVQIKSLARLRKHQRKRGGAPLSTKPGCCCLPGRPCGWFLLKAGLPVTLDTFDAVLDRICVETYCYEENAGRLDRAGVLAGS